MPEQALLELRLPGSSVLQHPRGVLLKPLDHPLRRRIHRVRDRGGHDLIDVLSELLDLLGFKMLDMFVLVQAGPPARKLNYQLTARKNHSYALVAEFRS